MLAMWAVQTCSIAMPKCENDTHMVDPPCWAMRGHAWPCRINFSTWPAHEVPSARWAHAGLPLNLLSLQLRGGVHDLRHSHGPLLHLRRVEPTQHRRGNGDPPDPWTADESHRMEMSLTPKKDRFPVDIGEWSSNSYQNMHQNSLPKSTTLHYTHKSLVGHPWKVLCRWIRASKWTWRP